MIKLENISKIYNDNNIQVKALNNVSLSVEEKEFVSIIGSSGSGKSTMMNILGCLDVPTSGSYTLGDEDVSKADDSKLAHIRNIMIGFIFQSFNLLPKLSALDNVRLPMVYSGIKSKERDKRAKDALIRVGLGDRMEHTPTQLSGGQKQRVAIARALVNNPKIILADEPTGNLDSKSESEIIKILQSLNKEGVTIVMVTHELSIAESTKRIITFKDGELISDEKGEYNEDI